MHAQGLLKKTPKKILSFLLRLSKILSAKGVLWHRAYLQTWGEGFLLLFVLCFSFWSLKKSLKTVAEHKLKNRDFSDHTIRNRVFARIIWEKSLNKRIVTAFNNQKKKKKPLEISGREII